MRKNGWQSFTAIITITQSDQSQLAFGIKLACSGAGEVMFREKMALKKRLRPLEEELEERRGNAVDMQDFIILFNWEVMVGLKRGK